MIRRGKTEGWLQLPLEAILPWAMLNNVSFDRTLPGTVAGSGGALLAKSALDGNTDSSSVLLTVPRDLILSLNRVQEHAKTDRDFREVLESLGDFGRVGVMAAFAIVLSTYSNNTIYQLLADSLSDAPWCNSFLPSCASICVMSISPAIRQHSQSVHRVSPK